MTFRKSFFKFDAAEGGEHTTDAGGNENTPPVESQETSSSANIEWKGNPDYFQNGLKQGTLKPHARKKAGGDTTATKTFGGLDLEALKTTPSQNAELPSSTPAAERKKQKEEKKKLDAQVAAKLVMRALDLVVGFISGGTYGADFTEQQTKARNKYREELEKSWEDYLMTLDIPLHPGLVAVVGSVFYITPALETERGKEKVQSITEKVGGKLFSWILRKKS